MVGVEEKAHELQQNPMGLVAFAMSVWKSVVDAMPTSGASLDHQAASCQM